MMEGGEGAIVVWQKSHPFLTSRRNRRWDDDKLELK